jgi:phage terminase Nu1 subunit (DNA packaging protein)
VTAFALEQPTDDYPLTTGALAKLIAERLGGDGPTTQTIRNHAQAGTIKSWKRFGKLLRFKPAAAQEYLANAPSPSRGGKRKNAGRKKNKPAERTDAPLTSRHADAAELRATIAARAADNEYPEDAMRLEDVLNLSTAELRVLAWIGFEEIRLNTAAISRMKEIQSEQLTAMKLAKERGELVKADAVTSAWTESCQRVIEAMNALPKRAADTLASVAWVTDETIDQLCSMLHHQGTEPDVIDEARAILARPADHRTRIRAVLDAQTARVRESIAEQPPAGLAAP